MYDNAYECSNTTRIPEIINDYFTDGLDRHISANRENLSAQNPAITVPLMMGQ